MENNLSILTSLPTTSNKFNKDEYKGIVKADKDVASILKSSLGRIKKDEVLQQVKKLSSIPNSSIAVSLSNKLGQDINQLAVLGKKVEILVDNTNEVIDNIETKEDITKAKIMRDNTLKVINDSENKLLKIRGILSKFTSLVSVFQTIINILSALPIPTSTPPGVGLPLGLIVKIIDKFQKAKEIVAALSAVLAIINPIIAEMIINLQDQRSRLKGIGDIIDDKSQEMFSSKELQDFYNSTTSRYGKLGIIEGLEYKGFKFALREENDPNFIVQGNKRRYAVALNRDGNEVLKSDASFTLDPDILIEELKLYIDSSDIRA